MPEESDPPIKPKRRWKRWVFGVLLLSLIGGLIWLNGPGARLIVDKVILQQLEGQKLSGTFEVEGTLMEGLSLHDIDLTGESKIQRVQSDLLKIEWSIPNLIGKKLDAITLNRLHLVIDPKAPPLPPKDDQEKDPEALEKTLELVRGLLKPSQISLTDINVEVRETVSVSLASLGHTPGTDAYVFEEFKATDHLERSIRNPRSVLTWTDAGLALDQFTVLPTLAIRDLNFALGSGLTVDVFIDESKISVASDLAKNHSIILKSPKLEIKKAAELYDPKLPAGGAITALEIDTSKGFVNIQGENLRWDQQELASASIEARAEDLTQPLQNPIKIEIALAEMLDLDGTVTIGKEILDSVAKLNFTLNYPEVPTVTGTIDYASREVELVANALDGIRVEGTYFVESSTYEARATADLPDASVVEKRLTGPLKFVATGSGSIPDKSHSGKLDLASLSLLAPNLPTAVAQGEVEWHWPKTVSVKRLKLSPPENNSDGSDGVRLEGIYFAETSTYEASAIADLADASILEKRLTGPLKFTAKGSGSISDKTHTGELDLDRLAVLAPNLPTAVAQGKIAWNWPESVTVRRLQLDPPEGPSDGTGGLRVEGIYFAESSTYEASARANLPDASILEKRLTGPLKFTASGSGSIPDKTHRGKLDLESLSFQAPNLPSATTQGEIAWNWPEGVTVARLQLDSPEGQVQAKMGWQEDVLTIEEIALVDSGARLLSIAGKLPAPLKFESVEAYLASDAPVELKVKSQPLTFVKLATFAPVPDSLRGVVQADLSLAGSLATPQLDGFVTVDDFRIATKPDIPPASIRLNFTTENQKLLLTASAREPGGPLLDVEGNIPFLPSAWLDRKKAPAESPLQLRLFSPQLDLRRIKPFVPAVKSIRGTLKLDMLVGGTLAKPDFGGTATIRVRQMRLANSPISDIRDASIDIRAKGKLITIAPSSVSVSGGNAKLSGTINLAGTEPVFDISANGKYLLLSRNADYTFRGNPNLRLRGPLSTASITGSLGIVESLFYKDIEILPFGVPRTTDIPRPTLPSFTPPPALPGTKKSGGFKDWTLDIDVTTQDPILVRGNLADGKIVGAVKVFGTIGNPKTSGSLTSQDLVADLPFSDLQVQSALITLRPDALTNPFVNVRGSSSVGQYTVQVYVTGSVQSPDLLLTSNPPLPENEIMLLLATGSASAQLEDRQVASQKALQYLLEGIRRRNGDKDKTVFQRLLKNSDQIELSLGDTDQFSGRQFSSASLDITDRFDFTTQIDENGETRALIVFSIRFK